MFSVSLMGFPLDVDSGRGIMFGSEVKQIQCIKDPDIPRVSTGHENMFGYVSHPYKEMKGDWKVVKKIVKSDYIYTLVLYNEKTDTYDMVEKRVGEALTEKFGYLYNTEFMDKLKVGSRVKNGDRLYVSNSIDKNGNVRDLVRQGKVIAVKADASTAYSVVSVVMDNLRTMKMNKFTLMTSLKQKGN